MSCPIEPACRVSGDSRTRLFFHEAYRFDFQLAKRVTIFLSSHLYSMSSHLDNERILLTSLSCCGIIFRKSAPQTQKKEKSLSPEYLSSVAKAKGEDSLIDRAYCVERGPCAGLSFRALRLGGVLHALRHPVYALGHRHRHAQFLRLPHHVAGYRLELGLAPRLDVLRHRAGVLRERRLPSSDLLHEVHRIEFEPDPQCLGDANALGRHVVDECAHLRHFVARGVHAAHDRTDRVHHAVEDELPPDRAARIGDHFRRQTGARHQFAQPRNGFHLPPRGPEPGVLAVNEVMDAPRPSWRAASNETPCATSRSQSPSSSSALPMPFWKVTSTGRPSSTGRIEANAASVACDFTRMITASKERLPISAALAKAASFVTDSVRPVSARP